MKNDLTLRIQSFQFHSNVVHLLLKCSTRIRQLKYLSQASLVLMEKFPNTSLLHSCMGDSFLSNESNEN